MLPRRVASGQRGGHEEREIARDRLQRRRREVGPRESGSTLFAGIDPRNSSTTATGPVQIEGLGRRGMEHAETRQHRLGPKAQGGGLARMELAAQPRP